MYFVRHGEAELNVKGILQSRDYDTNPLTPRGRLEAAAATLLLRRLGVDGYVFTSPLRRARETAMCISAEARVDERLREVDMGEWELRSIHEVPFDKYRLDPVSHGPPGGESMDSVVRRVRDFMDFAKSLNTKAVIAVSHWHPIATALALVMGLPLSRIYRIRISTGSISAVDLGEDEVLFINLSPLRVLRGLGFNDAEIMRACAQRPPEGL